MGEKGELTKLNMLCIVTALYCKTVLFGARIKSTPFNSRNGKRRAPESAQDQCLASVHSNDAEMSSSYSFRVRNLATLPFIVRMKGSSLLAKMMRSGESWTQP